MRTEWTEDELLIIKENYQNMNDEELSLLIPNHSVCSIATKRKRMGLTKSNAKYSYADVVKLMKQKGYQLISSESEYKDAGSKMKYICPKHKDKGALETTLGHLLEGKGCIYCGRDITISARTKDIDIDECISLCKKNNFQFIKAYRKEVENNRTKPVVDFICNNHLDKGIQTMILPNMRREICGCYYCRNDYNGATHRVDINDANDYLKSKSDNIILKGKYTGISRKVLLSCTKCNHQWYGRITDSKMCPNCESGSYGEKLLREFFKENNIVFIEQKTFRDCKNINPLRFDFYLPYYHTCIEYQGRQHYVATENFGGEKGFELRKKNDDIKRKFCKDNHIRLYEIDYTYNTKYKIKEYFRNINNNIL